MTSGVVIAVNSSRLTEHSGAIRLVYSSNIMAMSAEFMREHEAYVDTVMGSQQASHQYPIIPENTESIVQTSRKRSLSGDEASETTDTPKKKRVCDDINPMDSVIIQQMRIMTDEMKTTFEARFDKLEDRLRNEFVKIVKNEVDIVKNEFNARMENMSKKLEEKLVEKTTDLVNLKMTEIRSEVKTNMDKLNKSVEDRSYAEVATNGPKENLNFVIRNMDLDQREETEPEITMNKVKSLIKDGLKASDIVVKSAIRKKSLNNSRPGVIIASVETAAQKTKLMKSKGDLKVSRCFYNVYIEEDRPHEVRTSEANMRTLLYEMGKSDKYVNVNGRFVRKRNTDTNRDDQSFGHRTNNNINSSNRNNRYGQDTRANRGGHGRINGSNRNNNNNNNRR